MQHFKVACDELQFLLLKEWGHMLLRPPLNVCYVRHHVHDVYDVHVSTCS